MSLLANYYWKKAAAQVTDDGAVERAFMDQAYGFLANKAGKLMQDQHRLGFEVVYKNDSNTRMVGIFAFRINDQLLYAPVFFLNGEIKGTDLLYRQETKTFVPLNEEWVSFLTEKSNYEAGTAIDKEHYSRTNNHVRFEDIAYPPASAGKKRASAELTTTEAVLKDVIENKMVTELAALNKQAGALIHKFIVEDGGNDAVAKIASLMESNFKFAEALVSNIQESDYLPTDIPAVKSASAPEPKLVLFTGALGTTPHSYLLKGATDAYAKGFFSKGYYLWDDRAESEIVPVYKDGTEQLEMVGSAGMYDVLMRDGSFRKAIVAPLSKENVKGYGPVSCDSGYSYYGDGPYDHARSYRDTYTPHVVCMLDGKKESDTENKVYGKFLKDQAAMIRDDDLSNKVKADQAYRIYDAEAGTISEPMYILSTKTTDGVHQYSFIPMYGGSNPQTITHNPDVPENDLPGNFVGAAAYFIPIATESMKKDTSTPGGSPYYSFYHEHIATPGIGCSDTMKQWALEHVKQASILFDDASNTFSWKTGYKDQSPYMSRMEFATKLASAGVHADTVEDMLDETVKSGSTSWYYGDPEMHKEAFPMRLTHQPVFRTENNTEFSVNQESPQSFMIGIQDNSIQKPGQKIGDAYDPGMGRKPEDGMHKDMLLKMQPDQIAQYASANELPNVFEHGLVGSLVQVYDSISMIDKYLPDMEEALDRLGRILFLFYWKPRDFEDAYGTDDMTNLENQILSNFKSFGSLVLDLTKRSKKRQTGSVSLGTN